MAGMTRVIHPQSNFFWRKLSDIAPDMTFQLADNNSGEPMALVLVDGGDAETHIYVFSEEGRQQLVKALTGGLVVVGEHLQ